MTKTDEEKSTKINFWRSGRQLCRKSLNSIPLIDVELPGCNIEWTSWETLLVKPDWGVLRKCDQYANRKLCKICVASCTCTPLFFPAPDLFWNGHCRYAGYFSSWIFELGEGFYGAFICLNLVNTKHSNLIG